MTNGILDSGQKIVTDGLVLNYDIAQLRSYPTTGTTVTDLSGSNKNATLINGVAFDSGNGGSLQFDGVNDYADLATSTVANLINGSVASSYSIWINNALLPATGVENYVSFQAIINGSSTALYCAFQGSNVYVGGRSQTSDTFNPVSTPYTSTNVWVNISTVYDYTNDLINIYINGSLAKSQSVVFGSNTFIKGTPTTSDRIGSITIGALFFNGKIGQFSLYNKGLTSTEVLQNFNANRLRYGL